jgi:DNA-directed RNA polymerase beta' subunit
MDIDGLYKKAEDCASRLSKLLALRAPSQVIQNEMDLLVQHTTELVDELQQQGN